jgi:PadR family transcriptional regulator
MITRRMDLPRDTLDLLILRALALEARPQHGWAVSHRVHQISGKKLLIQQGSLYPSLHRLEGRGWIKAKWGRSENNRRAKYYKLTKTGQKQLQGKKDSGRSLATAIAQILKTT